MEDAEPRDEHALEPSTGDEKVATGVKNDEAVVLQGLAATARDQDDLEKDIGRQADQMLLEQADERDQKRLEKTLSQKEKLVDQVRKLQARLSQALPSATSLRIHAEIDHLQVQIDGFDTDLTQIQQRIDERHNALEEETEQGPAEQHGNQRIPGESRRDFLIRTGKITPFSKMAQSLQRTSSNLADVMLDAEEEEVDQQEIEEDEAGIEGGTLQGMSHRNLIKPGFADDADTSQSESMDDFTSGRPPKRRKVQARTNLADSDSELSAPPKSGEEAEDEYVPDGSKTAERASDESDEEDMGVMQEGPEDKPKDTLKRKPKRRKATIDSDIDEGQNDLANLDDGNETLYQARLKKWVTGRKAARRKAQAKRGDGDEAVKKEESPTPEEHEADDEEEWYQAHPSRPDAEFDGGLRVPGDVFPSLFDYQKTGVQWLWELYAQQVGGIIGDEMGLGKTIQIIAFIAALHHSKLLKKPVIVVTPATVMKQWVNEFHTWWPALRVSILHTSGSGMMDVRRERDLEDEMESKTYRAAAGRKRSSKPARKIVERVLSEGHVLVTTYSGLQTYADILIPVDWGYAVLDEGHKIRNPNTSITIYCKELRTANRIILSGTPMQNNLTELWSLFDFIFPMRLGTLVTFRTQFEIPIKQGGYANASNLQVETALRCAETLKDAISPYLLQRFKIDVAADLPKKSEQVLFCRLTKLQREHYESFLRSNDMTAILGGKRHALFGIDILRKICNHPDLEDHKHLSIKAGYNYGSGVKSGKMQVVKALLELWRDTGHKTLLFAQHRIMLDILEKFLKTLGGFTFIRMDGTTNIKDRQTLVDQFNNDPGLHVFLLTTKVGGLGVNLTGADRVIIYDPDWNPSTDVQARERAWRLGQKREVIIYRLMTAGTIEEKIYHRQIFKQILTNKILRDPKQRQTFQLKDLHDLFTLGNADEEETETGGLFKGTEVQFRPSPEPADTLDPDNVVTNDNAIPTPPAEPTDGTALPNIIGISHHENFNDGTSGTSTTNPSTTQSQTPSSTSTPTAPSAKETRLLSTIFARSGVHSALEHDAIINGASSNPRGTVTADPAIIAREARRVAAAAAKELQRASQAARSVPVGTPTWTGLVGVAGRPEDPPSRSQSPAVFGGGGRGGGSSGRGGRGGATSSSSILANLAARQAHERPTGSGSTHPGTAASTADDAEPRGKDFLILIRDYLRAHGGAVYTQMLIDHFNRFCRTPERTAEFKEMLRQIAVLERREDGGMGVGGRGRSGRMGRGGAGGGGGRAKWVLKKEFGGSGSV